MTDGALFVSWGELIPGREATGAGVLAAAMSFLQGLQKAGKIAAAEAVILEPTGGTTLGFVLVKGDKHTLSALRVAPEFLEIIIGIQLVHRNVAVAWAHAGQGLGQVLGLWGRREAELLGNHAETLAA
jgi:hypothetical protein